MNRSHEHAGALLAKARDDAGMMLTLMAAPDSPDWGVGFHAQQAVASPRTMTFHSWIAIAPDGAPDK